MRMQTSIPMMGQPVNAMASFGQGLQAAALQNQIGDQNRLRDVFRTQGQNVLAGDQGALDALAMSGPQGAEMAMGVQSHRQNMEVGQHNLVVSRQEAATRAAELAATMGAQERERVLGVISSQAPAAIRALQSGDIAGFNAILDPYRDTLGFAPARDAQEARLQMELIEGVADGIAGVMEAAFSTESAPSYRALNGQLINENAPGGPSVVDIQGMPSQTGGSAAEQSIARMMEIGIPREIAIRIEDGVYRVATDPVTRDTVVVDLSTGQQVYRVNPQENAQAPASQPSGDNNTGATPNLSFGETPGNAQNAFGLRGMAGGVANAVSDFIGAGEIAPEIAENQRFFRTYEEDALVFLAQAYPRQPAQALMERIRSLVPNVGSTEGAGRALGELRALRDRFASDLQSAEAQLGRRLSPTDRAQANARASALREMLSRTDQAIGRFGGGNASNQNTTSSGVTWEVVE